MCILYFRRSSQAKKPSSPPNFRSGTPVNDQLPLRGRSSSRNGTSTGSRSPAARASSSSNSWA